LEKEIQSILDNYKRNTNIHFNTHECKNDIQSMRKIQNAKWCSVRPLLTNIDKKIIIKLSKLKDFDLIILDIMLPGINGLDVCKEIRKNNKNIPILFLTALSSSENIVLGLESGGDDYLVKPFKFIELVARIKSLLRRSHQNNLETTEVINENIYQFSDVTVNDYTKKVIRGGEEISLTSTEYKLLLYFLNNPEKVISRAEILDAVWGVNYELGTNVVDVYVNYLRKKLDNQEENKIIHTVIGMGYVLKKP
jgi:DNA-binding response OmpR family regulator